MYLVKKNGNDFFFQIFSHIPLPPSFFYIWPWWMNCTDLYSNNVYLIQSYVANLIHLYDTEKVFEKGTF